MSCAVRLLIVLIIGLGLYSKVFAGDFDTAKISQEGLTANQARQVLVVVLEKLHFKLSKKGMYIDGPLKDTDGKPFRVGYFDFGLTFDSPNAGATDVLGHYAVNAMTGDVWETEQCVRYKFSKLTLIQKRITKQTGAKFVNENQVREKVGC